MKGEKNLCIIGAGISGLACAYYAQKIARGNRIKLGIKVVEKAEKTGGRIDSIKEKGYLCEKAANGFLDNKTEIISLCEELGIDKNFIKAKESAKIRYAYINSELKQIPSSLGSFLFSDIISLKGKLRAFKEIFTEQSNKEDESIFEFASRHLGNELAEIISLIAIGIFAGDAKKLSIRSCFPNMLNLEKLGNGSLLMGMFKMMREAKKHGKKARIGGILTSFREGSRTLIEALENSFDGEILLTESVESIEKSNGKFVLRLSSGREEKCDAVILACQSYASAEILKSIDKELCRELAKIYYAPLNVVYLAYDKSKIKNFKEAFGFLVHGKEGRKILGARFDSCIFENRAPENKILAACMLGGDFFGEVNSLSNDELLEIAKSELSDIAGISAGVEFFRIFRHERAIPQYYLNHHKIIEKIWKRLNENEGIFITGNFIDGVSMNDCIRNAKKTAERAVAYLA